MQEFEKLGQFYLGKRYELDKRKLTDDLVLYDSKDLTTHAVIIGMTGSGKTGLGIGMLEEAAMDHIPVIAIDPKGDLGNILLTFPSLSAAKFKPWINEREAKNKKLTVAEYAKKQSTLWRNGLKDWGQDGERIEQFRDSVDLSIYTPGSTAGLQISVLQSFRAPGEAVREDTDLYRQKIQSTATSILALLDEEADPLTSREHILIANILEHYWNEGRDLDIAGMIQAIQSPPMERIGVMNMDSFYKAKDRFALSMKLNNLLAAPGFEAWMEGEPLDAGKLLYTEDGLPRISVVSIAHLSEPERMFFVSMLLNEILSWVRTQPGTSSLRAILYMDEIFGYMPPLANPPSKTLLLTLLKQARAYGLGLVLATQNPVDLDYKGLSNTGTWMIGRLQTERDKMRVMEGLEGAAAGGHFNKKKMEQTLAGLGKRVFLMHNVHEKEPVTFHTRWVMSYLPGPFTRNQIKKLMKDRREEQAEELADARPAAKKAKKGSKKPPALVPDIDQYYLPLARHEDNDVVYCPMVIGAADVGYTSARYKVNDEKRFGFLVEVEDGPVALEWDEAEELGIDFDKLLDEPEAEGTYEACPSPMSKAKSYTAWAKSYKSWLRNEQPITLFKSPTMKMTSTAGESEGDFRVRLQQDASEKRDKKAAAIKKRYASKLRTLESRKQRAEQKVAVQKSQAKQKKLDTAVAFGSAILGAVLGRKKISSTSASRVGTAMKSAGRMRKESADVQRARELLETVDQQMAELSQELENEIEMLDATFDSQEEELEEIIVKPKSTEIHVHFVGLAWAPHHRVSKTKLEPAWI